MCHLRWKMRRDACAVCCVTRSTLYMRRVACKHGEYDGKTSGWKQSSANPVAARTQRRDQKGQGKIPLKKQPCFCCTKLTASFTNARLRALACSSQPAAASPVEASPTASAPTALHDAQACKRMRQKATQLRGGAAGTKKGEGKIPLETRSSGCCLHSALHATVCLPYAAQIFSFTMLHAHALMSRRAVRSRR